MIINRILDEQSENMHASLFVKQLDLLTVTTRKKKIILHHKNGIKIINDISLNYLLINDTNNVSLTSVIIID